MDVKDIKAVIGTNSWGSSLYGKAIRGSAVSEDIIKEAVEKAVELDMAFFDTAQDYGLGKCQPMIGRLCGKDILISAKYTPMSGNYKQNQVRNSLMKDLEQMNREAIDIYWLHLPNSIDENIKEMIALYREGKILNIGVSNFTLEECKKVKGILDAENIPFYAVQNHYSIINREWEKEGLVDWCKENNIKFWAWAVLEEGLLAGPKKKDEKWSIMKVIFHGRRKKLNRLFALMKKAGDNHNLSIAQVAMAFVATKGIIPICGCRKPNQVQELYDAVNTTLSPKEMKKLEQIADELNVKIFGKDIFRFAVRKSEDKENCMAKLIRTTVKKDGFEGILYPGDGSKDKILIVVSGSNGGMKMTAEIAGFYHDHGIPALAVAMFNTKQTINGLVRVPLEYVECAIKWLKEQGYQKIGIDGTSKGSEYALLCASYFHEISCVIARVPSYFVSEGLENKGKSKNPSGTSCWSYRGKELPFAAYKTRNINPIKLILKEKELRLREINSDKDVEEEHIIKVENIKAPILLLSAKNDMVWPSYESALYIEKRLKEHGFPYRVKHVAYPAISHIMLTDAGFAYKCLFKTERRNKEACAKERKRLKEELLSWVGSAWQEDRDA